jgi:hypothetical protein
MPTPYLNFRPMRSGGLKQANRIAVAILDRYFVSVMTDRVMHKETGLEIESDWLLDGYGIGSAPAAIGRHATVPASERNGRGHNAPGLASILHCHSWVLEGAGWDRLARPALSPAEGWAYAGAFFDLTGAAASHLVCGSASWRVVMTIVLAAVAVISWALRPSTRTLGILFPPALFRRKKEA